MFDLPGFPDDRRVPARPPAAGRTHPRALGGRRGRRPSTAGRQPPDGADQPRQDHHLLAVAAHRAGTGWLTGWNGSARQRGPDTRRPSAVRRAPCNGGRNAATRSPSAVSPRRPECPVPGSTANPRSAGRSTAPRRHDRPARRPAARRASLHRLAPPASPHPPRRDHPAAQREPGTARTTRPAPRRRPNGHRHTTLTPTVEDMCTTRSMVSPNRYRPIAQENETYGDLRIMPMLWREVLVGAGLRFQLSA